MSRRQFVQVLGGALSLAALPACERPVERILPFVGSNDLVPGEPTWYATAMDLDGFGTGLLVESREGRPIKIEGNPLHPASLGGTGAIEQGSLLDLYDADRARFPIHQERRVTVAETLTAIGPAALASRIGAKGTGLRILLPPTSSPTEADLLDRIRDRYPEAGIHFYAPFSNPPGSEATWSRQHDLARARIILTIQADVLGTGPLHLRYARAFAGTREPGPDMSRLYTIESGLTITGAAADHRIALRPGETAGVLTSLLDRVEGRSPGPAAPWIGALADDLLGARGRSVVIVGSDQPAALLGLGDRLNRVLGNLGTTTWFTRSPLYGAGDPAFGLVPLVEAMHAGAVSVLVSAEVNPCYATPGALRFAAGYDRVSFRWHAATHREETGRLAEWFQPLDHYLETWGDLRGFEGTPSLIQPLIRPLYESVGRIAILAALAGESRAAHDLVQEHWQRRLVAEDFPSAWTDALRTGILPGGPAASVSRPEAGVPGSQSAPTAEGVDLLLVPDPGVYDGRFANNAWLQELPRPLTTLTWGNAAELCPGEAGRLGVANGDLLELEQAGVRAILPALVVPGLPDHTIVAAIGFGRHAGGSLAAGLGADLYPLWPADRPSWIGGVSVRKAGGQQHLALTQGHWDLSERSPVHALTRDEAAGLRRSTPEPPITLYQAPPPRPGAGGENQWAMVIDLSRCTGCSACVVACQAENNVPAVGREEVSRRHEMHWLRIDSYLGPRGGPERLLQPMLCQHCEMAPCEYVCPVGATTHSPDGINEMTYNRCVGTRFCSNNCPYKVRRFNWFDYNQELSEVEQLVKNPDVTVRQRGVMEKCTFCVQRIREAEIQARVAGRPLRGIQVRTACQQACPSEAIRFGSLTEAGSEVARLRSLPRAYAVLEELGTRPRVRYLARVSNPNPAFPLVS